MQPPHQSNVFGKDGGSGEGRTLFQKGFPSSDISKPSRNTLIVALGTFVSRLLGFGRDAGIAWLLGGSGTADALTAALRIPYMARRLFGEGTLSLSLTAACTREHWRGGSGCGLALAVMRKLALWGGLLTLTCLAGATAIMNVCSPGLPEATLAEAATLFRICTPYIWSVLLAACCMAALHSQQRFWLPTLTPSLFNLCVIGATLTAACIPTQQPATLVACGVLCGGILQWLIQLPATLSLHREETPKNADEGTVSETLHRLPAGIAGAAMPQLAFLGASALASLLPEGHMAALFYAERLLEFPLGVLGAAVGMAAAPRLAELAASEGFSRSSRGNGTTLFPRRSSRPVATSDVERPEARIQERGRATASPFASEIQRAALLSLGLNLPAAAGLAAVSSPLVAAVLGHGAFDAGAVSATALALCAYAPGLPAYALSRPLLAACHALENGVPLKAALAALCTALATGFLLTPHLGAWGPPLGVSIGLWCNALLLWMGVARRVPLRLPLRATFVQIAGTALTFGAACGCIRLLAESSVFAQLALAVPAGAAAYGCTLLFFDNSTLRLLKKTKA